MEVEKMKVNYLVKIYGPRDEEILVNFDPSYKGKEIMERKSAGEVISSLFVAWMRSLARRGLVKVNGQ